MYGKIDLSCRFRVNVDWSANIFTEFFSNVWIRRESQSHFLTISQKYLPGNTTTPVSFIDKSSFASIFVWIEISEFDAEGNISAYQEDSAF